MSATVADLPAGDFLVPAGDSLADRSVADRSVTELARLLEHPAIWRGRSAARAPPLGISSLAPAGGSLADRSVAARSEVLPTGYAAFDACLPGGGWPRTGLIEILVPALGLESYIYCFRPSLR